MTNSVALLSAVGVLLMPSTAATNLADVPCGVRQLSGRQARIKGGQEAYPGQFPWSASVQHRGSHFCMGAIISAEYVLTAAHCFGGRPAGQFTVVVGGHNLTAAEASRHALPVAQRIVHDGYVDGKFDNDVALLRLGTKLDWDDFVQPACLPAAGADAKQFVGMKGVLAGWGYLDEWRSGGTRPDALHWTALPVLSRQTCQQWFNDANTKVKVSEGKICAGFKEGGKDSCQADSGGALTVQVGQQYQVAGVVSAGIGCGRPGLPGIYTDVTQYTKWIVGHVQA